MEDYYYLLTKDQLKELEQRNRKHPHGSPITLIKFRNGKPLVDDEEFKKLKDLFTKPELCNRKIVVLSIVGVFRSGKSFFLDFILRFLYARVDHTLFLTFSSF
jgi:hypothetical protein